jgi:Ca2+-dependent lipid-binding protein
MNMGDTEKLFDKIDEIQKDLAEVKSDIKVMKAKEQPSFPCRQYIQEAKQEVRSSIASVSGIMESKICEVEKKIDKKVGHSLFWKISGVLFSLILGSFVFTWLVFVIIGAK